MGEISFDGLIKLLLKKRKIIIISIVVSVLFMAGYTQFVLDPQNNIEISDLNKKNALNIGGGNNLTDDVITIDYSNPYGINMKLNIVFAMVIGTIFGSFIVLSSKYWDKAIRRQLP